MELLRNARLVTGGRIVDDAWVAVDGGLIIDKGAGPKPGGRDLGGSLLAAGFVDIHVHGAAGFGFRDADPSRSAKIAAVHRRHGTTTMLAGLASDDMPRMVAAAGAAADSCDRGDVAGTFFEGPFLSIERKGAHLPAHLRRPDVAEFDQLFAATRGTARMIAIAPELPDAGSVIGRALAAGVVVATGHTDASYDEARVAFDAGARVATHLFNGMPPLHHREPGVALAAMQDERIVCELITDGFHVDTAMIRHVFDTVGAARIALITDAIEATGVGDGVYHHSGSTTVVQNGLAMLEDGSSIAGSTLTMDCAVRNTVQRAGISLPVAVYAATATPARALGLDGEVGSIVPGLRADLVVLGQDLLARAVMSAGVWTTAPWAEDPLES